MISLSLPCINKLKQKQSNLHQLDNSKAKTTVRQTELSLIAAVIEHNVLLHSAVTEIVTRFLKKFQYVIFGVEVEVGLSFFAIL